MFRCSATELHGEAVAGLEPATFGIRRNPRLHHRRKTWRANRPQQSDSRVL